jgi:hypothetical protein
MLLKSPGEPGVFCLEVKENWGNWQGEGFYFKMKQALKREIRVQWRG